MAAVNGDDRKVRNRLYTIREHANGAYAADVPHIAYQPNAVVDRYNTGGTVNTANNYAYDALGNRIRDTHGQIDAIEWTVAGKVKAVHRTPSSGKMGALFAYGADGNRILKEVRDDADDPQWREHHVLDAQGNIMAIYKYDIGQGSLKVTDRPIYGSSRLGVDAFDLELAGAPPYDPMHDPTGLLKYELSDHLGNVAAVMTDELLGVDVDSDSQYEYFQPFLLSASLHEPYGMNLTGMNWQSDVARFGFQGQLKDIELNAIPFKYRMYSPAGDGFWSVDPLAAKYPWNSPYAFSENRVMDMLELEGLETALTPDKAENDPMSSLPNGGEGYTVSDTQELPDGNTWTIFKGPKPGSGGGASSSASSGGNSPSLLPNGSPLAPKHGGGGYKGPTVSPGRPNFAFNVPLSKSGVKSSNSSGDVLNYFNIALNTAAAVAGTIEQLKKFDSKATFRFAERVNGRVMSAAEVTSEFQGRALRVMNVAKMGGTVFGVTGLVTGAYDLKSSFNQHGLLSPETAISALKLSASATLFVYRTTPIGAGLGIAWGIGNAFYDAIKED